MYLKNNYRIFNSPTKAQEGSFAKLNVRSHGAIFHSIFYRLTNVATGKSNGGVFTRYDFPFDFQSIYLTVTGASNKTAKTLKQMFPCIAYNTNVNLSNKILFYNYYVNSLMFGDIVYVKKIAILTKVFQPIRFLQIAGII